MLPNVNRIEKIEPEIEKHIIIQYKPLVKNIVNSIYSRLPHHVDIDDLISAGMIGLLDAARKFDYSKNISFKTYAYIRIKGSIQDELRAMDWTPRSIRARAGMIENCISVLERQFGRSVETEEVVKSLGMTFDSYYSLLDEVKRYLFIDINSILEDMNTKFVDEITDYLQNKPSNNPYLLANFMELHYTLWEGIESLKDKEKLLISLYYYDDFTMKEIGEIMGCTESRISQMHSKIILHLKNNFNE